ncbi:hypothetical protein HDU81_003264 [Chytriomyces hyalinus]|nr:hypothetical protein HDU81_003264 [Chytriomyces hyalinus]
MSKVLGIQLLWPHLAEGADRSASNLVGRFQRMKTLHSPHLCQCIDAGISASGYIYTVLEHFPRTLADLVNEKWVTFCHQFSLSITTTTANISGAGGIKDAALLRSIALQLVSGLEYLHANGVAHFNLSLGNILLDASNSVKLSNYHLYHITKGGELAEVSIGSPAYLAPELIASGGLDAMKYCHKGDVWTVGLILVDICLGPSYRYGGSGDLSKILDIQKMPWLDHLHDALVDANINADLISFISRCLTMNVVERPSFYQLLRDSLFTGGQKAPPRTESLRDAQKSIDDGDPPPQRLAIEEKSIRYRHLSRHNLHQRQQQKLEDSEQSDNYLSSKHSVYQPPQLSLTEQYHLHKLGSSISIEQILAKYGIGSIPSIDRLPLYVSVTTELDKHSLADNTRLIHHVSSYQDQVYTFTIDLISGDIEVPVYTVGLAFTDPWTPTPSARSKPRKPLQLKEKNAFYQVSRLLKFKLIVREFPLSAVELQKEAAIDIPPLLRGIVWACLLGISPDVNVEYDFIDKNTPTSADRQLELDIPRCHQYNELLSSEEGHMKMARILKAWVLSEEGKLVYWQGLDSLMAPFLALNFNDEARAFLCLKAFIGKYFDGLFVEDNSVALNRHITAVKCITAYRDPQLASHLIELGITPDMFAIPWIMTMFAQIFQLDRLYHLWDTILLGPKDFCVFLVYAIVHQIRDQLLNKDFSSCLVLFSELPPIDIETCIYLAVEAWRLTPPSVYSLPALSSASWVGQIGIHEFTEIVGRSVIVDCRSAESFQNHHVAGSISFQPQMLETIRKKSQNYLYVVCIYATPASVRGAVEAHELVKSGVSHVCILVSTLSGLSSSIGMCCCGSGPQCTFDVLQSIGLT